LHNLSEGPLLTIEGMIIDATGANTRFIPGASHMEII
jgi:hypothetical protein